MSAVEATPITGTQVNFLRIAKVREITGMGTTFIYTEMAAGRFPRQRKIGRRAVAWREDEVRAWQAEKEAAANQEA
ncbi:helix-turn-helix transcriptional regulator [Aquipseudomonas alcaligenes]|uniref:helix-turn-helix transcriptional regulator n=1 Tax=Aquipseudomonas alcaligenes TaxID=43263 RepID=UPI003663BC02